MSARKNRMLNAAIAQGLEELKRGETASLLENE